MSLGEADRLRRAMSKKRDYEDFEAHRARFVEARSPAGGRDVAEEIWRQIESFAGYSFCKAHSASWQVSFRRRGSRLLSAFMASVLANGGFYPRSPTRKARHGATSGSRHRASAGHGRRGPPGSGRARDRWPVQIGG
jgi:hypothetical protein